MSLNPTPELAKARHLFLQKNDFRMAGLIQLSLAIMLGDKLKKLKNYLKPLGQGLQREASKTRGQVAWTAPRFYSNRKRVKAMMMWGWPGLG